MAGISGSLGNLWVEIGARITKFEQGMVDVSKAVGKTIDETEKKFAGFDKLGGVLTGLGAGFTAGITLPLVGIGAAAFKASGDFDSALRLISARGDITGQDLEKLKKQAEDLGAKTQFSSRQAADGMAELAGAGFKTGEIFDAIPGSMNLAAAAGTSVGESAKVTKDILGQFGLTAKDAGSTVDILTKASNESSGTLGEMANSLKYVGAPAREAGLSLLDTATALVALDKAGIRGEQAGTSLRSMLLSLQGPTKAAQDILTKYNITLIDSHGALLPLPQLMDNIKAGLAQIPGPAGQAAALTKIFGENAVTAAQGLVRLGSEGLNNIQAEMKKFQGEAERTASVMNSGLGGAIERMKGSIETAAQKIGDAFAPQIIKLAGYIETAANGIAAFAGWFGKLPGPVQTVTLAVVAFMAALGPLLLIAGQFAGSIGSISAALTLMTPALEAGSGIFTRLGSIMGTVGGVASSLLVPALIAIGAAITAIAIVDLVSELSSLEETMALASRTTVTSESAFTELAKSFDLGGTAAQGFGGSLSTINFGNIDKECVDAANSTRSWTDALNDLERKWKSLSWTDLFTPIGMFKKLAKDATEQIQFWTGAYPEMKKAAEDSLGKVETYTTSLMRRQGEHAAEVGKLQAANAKLAESHTAAGKAATDHGEALKNAKVHVTNLADNGSVLAERLKLLNDKYKEGVQEVAKWQAAHQTAASITPKLTETTKELDKAITDMISHVSFVGPAFLYNIGEAKTSLEKAAQPIRDLEAAYKKAGTTSTEVLQKQADEALKAYETIRKAAPDALNQIGDAWKNYEEKRAALAKATDGEVAGSQQESLNKSKDALDKSHSEQLSAWGKFSTQVSTIITDAGKSIVDRFLKTGEINDKLDEEAAKLKTSLADREQSYNDYAASVQASLADAQSGYEDTLEKEEKKLRDSLHDRQKDYEDFAKDVTKKLDDLRKKHEDEARKERKSLLDSLDDKTQDYEDYKIDIEGNIADIRRSHAEAEKKEKDNLAGSLADRTLDYNRYVEDVNTKLARIREKNKGGFSTEEQDLLTSLKRKTEDYNAYVADNAKQVAEVTAKHASEAARQEQEQRDSLARRARDFKQYQDDIAQKLDDVTAKHKAEQEQEEQDLRDSLDKKKQDLDEYTADATQKFEDVKQAAAKKLDEQTADLQAKLAKQTDEWEKYKNDANAKLQEIEDKHIGIFGRIKEAALGAFTDIGAAIGRFVTETLIGSLFKQLGKLVDDILPSVGKALGGIFGGGASAAAGTATNTAGNIPSQVGGVTSAVGSSLTSVIGAIGSIGSLVTGAIGNFQNAKQESTLNSIDKNTLNTQMYLGERADGGILGVLFRVQENTQYVQSQLGDVNNKLNSWLEPLAFKIGQVSEQLHFAQTRFDEISRNTSTSAMNSGANSGVLQSMLMELRNLSSKQPVINVYVDGVKTAARTSTDNFKMNGILTL